MGPLYLAAMLLLALVAGAGATPESDARKLLVQAMLSTSEPEQIKLIGQVADTGAEAVSKTIIAWREGGIYLYEAGNEKIPYTIEENQDADGKIRGYRVDNGELLKDDKGVVLKQVSSDLNAVDTSTSLRKALQHALDLLGLSAKDPQVRRSAVMKLGMSQKKTNIPLLDSRQEREHDPLVLKAIQEARALIDLSDSDTNTQADAIRKLAALHSIGSYKLISDIAVSPAAKNAKPAQAALKSLDGYMGLVNFYGTLFRGLSLGSVLLVVAIGLAITFGLMGVINMAHGELIAVGAYATYVVQNIFGAGLAISPFGFNLSIPGMGLTGGRYDAYFLASLPVAFLSAALVGLLLERTIIQFLYRRPLESLLATWGVSLVLQQAFRLIFGAANVQVNSPGWLSGNFTINDVILGYNRIFVIAFAVIIVIATWLLLTRTPLGLLIRAVMQKRDMAACVGVRTERVNMMTFALGSGLAGLAGAFLSQIGNVGPSLGQSYIVDCFMTVVVGGVGNLVGTICSALGIGVMDETLQPFIGPVMGKITVLGLIILFLQWRPAGLFVTKSRSLEG